MSWFTALLDQLGGKSFAYVLLVLGSIFAIIAFAQFPIDNTEPITSETVWDSLALGGLSLLLIGSSLSLFFKENSLKNKIADKSSQIENLENDLFHKNEEVFKLNQAIQRARKFIKENTSDENKALNDSFIDILGGISEDFSVHSSEYIYRKQAADWVKQRITKWTAEITLDNYSKYEISTANINDFRSDVVEHLELLCDNIREAKNSAPLLVNPPIKQRLENPFPYEMALKNIEGKALRELTNEKILPMNSIQIMKDHMSSLIEVIGYS